MTPTYQSMRKPGDGPGTDHSVRWMCGHTMRGGQFRPGPGKSRMPWRCAHCVEAAKAAKAAGQGAHR